MEILEDLLFGTGPIRAVQQLIGPGLPGLFEGLSLLGDTWGILLVVGIVRWLWGREATYALVGIVAVSAPMKEVMSMLFGRPRPAGPGIIVYEHLEVSSFPSGHVFQIVAAWGLLYAWGRVPLLVPALVALVVGGSRLYLGVHFLSDVLFAVLFAILVVAGYRPLWPRVEPWLRQRSQGFFLLLAAACVGAVVASMAVTLNNPRRWEILGLVVGLAAGLLVEHGRAGGRRLPPADGRAGAARVVLGTAGILLCLLVDRLFDEDALVPGLFTAGGAALWAVLGAPVLFERAGRAAPERKGTASP